MTDPSPDWPARDLLAHRVGSTPDATAVVDARDGDTWTYGDLDALVTATADQFDAACGGTDRSRGRNGDRPRVAIDAETSPRFVVALFAAWRLGAQVVPLPREGAATDRRSRLARLDPELVVGRSPVAASDDRQWPRRSMDDVSLDPTAVATASESRRDVETAGQWGPDETALVLFTSGTTGEPKGVRLTHRNLVASATGSAFRLGLAPDERWFDCLPTNHMGGLAPIVRSTAYGTTVLLQREFDAERTGRAMTERGATAVSLVPTQLRRLLGADWQPPAELRFVLLGGAPASPDLLADCEAAGVPVCPTYGTTETASQISTATPEEARTRPETVGAPLVVADVTVVDPSDGTPVEPGETGELVVDGPVVTPGYLDSDATEAAFGPAGLHTGDLASRDGAGRLRIHGRVDDAVQTGGETVHPWRVADALVTHPAVTEAAVVGLPDDEWGERVAALVVPEPGATVDAEALRTHCRESLAAYELPKTVRTATALPRTDSGTVDRSAVRERLDD